MEQDELQQIDTALNALPQEAKDFLYRGPYFNALQEISQTFSLTDDQRKDLDFHITQVLILLEHRKDLIDYIATLGLASEKQQAMLTAIEEKIIMPIVAATNFVEEGEEGIESLSAAPSPADVLATLKNRLTATQNSEPAARSMDISKNTPPKPIDPYREAL